jgi:hypothetical protein
VLKGLAWVIAALGSIAAVAALVSGMNDSTGLASLLAAALVLVYTAGGWATAMLGSLVARYIGLRSDSVD